MHVMANGPAGRVARNTRNPAERKLWRSFITIYGVQYLIPHSGQYLDKPGSRLRGLTAVVKQDWRAP
jgi:hypothetical protein